MALKNVFDTMKRGGYVVRPLEDYLLKKQDEDHDRAFNVNAPSSIGSCLRARYYARIGTARERVSARSQRIFDNGTYVHLRIQNALKKCGILVMDEVPVFSAAYNIQGHTDGLIQLSKVTGELGILEIKSINSRNFDNLKGAKAEHECQGLTYQYCVEEHRKFLREKYRDEKEFGRSELSRRKKYAKMYEHLKDGRKFSREEKIAFQVGLHIRFDRVLFNTALPIEKVVFLYENKDTQDMKEFVINAGDEKYHDEMREILDDCVSVDRAVCSGKPPLRPQGSGKSSQICRWCSFKNVCFVV